MNCDEKDVLLILCDISGYTRFMITNQHARIHSHVIVAELMKAILRHVKEPLKVSKLEGDAVFMYALRQGGEQHRKQTADAVLEMLDRFFTAFFERVTELEESNICSCEACKGIDRLRLKVIAHSGAALFHRIGQFDELSGVDVILVHRLLKNSLGQDRYLLLTEAAQKEIGLSETLACRQSEERYEELGAVRALVYLPPLRTGHGSSMRASRNHASLFFKAKDILIKIVQSRLMQLCLKPRPRFRNLPQYTAKENLL